MLSVKNRIIKTSRRDFRVNKLLFIITNLVLFIKLHHADVHAEVHHLLQ